MHVEQALTLAIALLQAVERALADGDSAVALTSALQATDDAAREELASAIADAELRLADGK